MANILLIGGHESTLKIAILNLNHTHIIYIYIYIYHAISDIPNIRKRCIIFYCVLPDRVFHSHLDIRIFES